MTFDEFTRSCGVGCHEPDVEYYMEKAWNAAVQACLDEVSQFVDCPPVVESYLERLKTPLEGSNDSEVRAS